ncbi:MAG: metal-dependent hydrolase [Candidatus Woesearchaeota archaeon]
MLFPAHIALSIIVLRLLIEVYPLYYSKSLFFIGLSIVFGLLPDFDIIGKKFKDHHKSLFHAPLFWIIICGLLFFINYYFALLFTLQIFIHLFSDYITARTAGISIFYPLSKKDYSLFPLKSYKGDFHLTDFKNYKEYLINYANNKILLIFEIGVFMIGIILIFI